MSRKRIEIKVEIKPLPPSATLVCPNPKCERVHALFWYVGSGKRQLSYRCDHSERTGHAKHTGSPIPVRTTAVLIAPPNVVPVEGLPEEWTTWVARNHQNKQQRTLWPT